MPIISLALGGGGVRGIAHIGVIRRLEQEGFQIGAIAGTSAGGIVGSLYAAGFSTYEIEEIFSDISRSHNFYRHSTDGPSLLGLGEIAEALENILEEKQFSQLKIPFACTAVDIKTAKEIILTRGSVLDAVLATIAVPGIFPAREINGFSLVDGGVLDPVPVALARWLNPALPVVAVPLSPVPEGWGQLQDFHAPPVAPLPAPILNQIARMRIGQAVQIFARSQDISAKMLTELRLQIDQPDAIIRPDVEQYGLLDEVDPEKLIHEGMLAAANEMSSIKSTFVFPSQIMRRFRKASFLRKVVKFDHDGPDTDERPA